MKIVMFLLYVALVFAAPVVYAKFGFVWFAILLGAYVVVINLYLFRAARAG